MPWTTATTRTAGFSVTATVWNNELVNNMNFLKEVHYSEYTTDASITATTAATANTVIAGSAVTYEAVPHMVTFSAPFILPDTTATGRQVNIELYVDGATIGTLGQVRTPSATGNLYVPFERSRRYTPSAASHTIGIRAWVNAGTGTVGATGFLAGFLRIVRVPT